MDITSQALDTMSLPLFQAEQLEAPDFPFAYDVMYVSFPTLLNIYRNLFLTRFPPVSRVRAPVEDKEEFQNALKQAWEQAEVFGGVGPPVDITVEDYQG